MFQKSGANFQKTLKHKQQAEVTNLDFKAPGSWSLGRKPELDKSLSPAVTKATWYLAARGC